MQVLRATVLVTVINAGFSNVLDRTVRDLDGVEWSYNGDDGPDHWPGLCQKGRSQSPININSDEQITPLFGLPLILDGDYKKTNEFTSSWNGHAYSAEFKKPYGLGLIGGGSLIDVYVFKSLHVHWGSEHTFDGKQYSAEMHLVNYNAKYSADEAGDHDDGYAVIGIMLKEVDNPPSSAMSDFLEAMTRDSDKPFKAKLRKILPERLEPWFRYQGSLTTPGCSENVKWTVLEKVVPIRKGIIKHDSKTFEPSYRPVQPVNNRTIYRSFSLSDRVTSNAFSNVINPILLITSAMVLNRIHH